jgi:drug/metabolite transporter (DMT)-like permease
VSQLTERRQRAQSALIGMAGMTLISPDGLIVNSVRVGLGGLLFVRGLLMAAGYLAVVRVRTGSFFKSAVWKLKANSVAFAVLSAAGNVLFVVSLRETTVADTLLINASIPALTGVIGWLSRSERPSRRAWMAAVGVLAGIALLAGAHPVGTYLLGDLAALGSAVALASALLVVPRGDDAAVSAAQALSGALGMVAFSPWARLFPTGTDLALAVGGFMCTLPIGSTLVMTCRRHLPAVDVGLMMLLESVLGPLWAWVGLRQTPSLQTVGAGAVIFISLAAYAIAGSSRFGDAAELVG